jgi:hypothetical protein
MKAWVERVRDKCSQFDKNYVINFIDELLSIICVCESEWMSKLVSVILKLNEDEHWTLKDNFVKLFLDERTTEIKSSSS